MAPPDADRFGFMRPPRTLADWRAAIERTGATIRPEGAGIRFAPCPSCCGGSRDSAWVRSARSAGKSLNIAPPGWQKTFDPLRDWQNHKHGWTRPDDPERRRTLARGHRAYHDAVKARIGYRPPRAKRPPPIRGAGSANRKDRPRRSTCDGGPPPRRDLAGGQRGHREIAAGPATRLRRRGRKGAPRPGA